MDWYISSGYWVKVQSQMPEPEEHLEDRSPEEGGRV